MSFLNKDATLMWHPFLLAIKKYQAMLNHVNCAPSVPANQFKIIKT